VTDRQVLVVADDPRTGGRSISCWLATGFDVCGVADGQSALECLAHKEFDLVTLDLPLPDLAGVEVGRRLRAWNRVPVLVRSAIGEEAMKVDTLESGADDYVTNCSARPSW